MRDEKVAYVLTAVLNPNVFQQILEGQKLPSTWATGIVGFDGRLIARVPRVPVGTAASKDYLARTSGAQEGWYRGKTLEGADTYTAFSRSDLTRWSIGYAIPADDVLGGVRRAGMAVLIGLAASLLAAFFIAVYLSKRITIPLQEIAQGAKTLPDGIAPAKVSTELTELAELSDALSATGQRLHSRNVELERTHQELRKQAVELQRVDANKSRFLALLAHELRNPLAPLRTGLALLAKTPDTRRQQELREMMERQLRSMARLIEDLGRVVAVQG